MAPEGAGAADAEHARDATRAIGRAIDAEDQRLRARFGWLRHQNALGAGLWLGALLTAVGLAAAHLTGRLCAALVVPLLALPLSILHELEHDLIHGLYFRRAPRVQHLMFASIWLSRMTMNPWTRRLLHLGHHRASGQPTDIEERLIGLGVRSVPLRLLVAFVPLASALLLPAIHRDAPRWFPPGAPHRRLRRWAGRLDLFFYVLPLLVVAGALAGSEIARAVLVVYVLPNLLRHGCIALLSSYSHYVAIPEREVYCQNQILRHPALWPLQLFCFNFGATHIIHHYVVNQPFYLRQMVAGAAHREMERWGVRVNDFGVVARANRHGFEVE